jgi:hypothetical protein
MESGICRRHVAEGNTVIDERHNASEMNIATKDSGNFSLNRESRVEAPLNQRITSRKLAVAFRNSG